VVELEVCFANRFVYLILLLECFLRLSNELIISIIILSLIVVEAGHWLWRYLRQFVIIKYDYK